MPRFGGAVTRPAIAALVAAHVVAMFAAAASMLLTARWLGIGGVRADAEVYFRAATSLLEGQVPYRNFPLEYPPLSLLFFAVPLLVGGGSGLAYDRGFGFPSYLGLLLLQNLLVSAAIALALIETAEGARTRRGARAVVVVYTVLLAATGPTIMWRYDLLPVLLTVLALFGVVTRRPFLAGLFLGLGVVAKLYPLLLVPVFGSYYVASGRSRSAATLGAGTVVAIASIMAPTVLVAGGEWASLLEYHRERGLQLESVPSGLIALAHVVGLTRAETAIGFGTIELSSPWADPALRIQPLLQIATVGLAYLVAGWRFRREYLATTSIDFGSLVASIAACLLAAIATSKVLSPQYLVWVLPFWVFLRSPPWQLFLVAAIATTALYPWLWPRLQLLEPLPVVLLNLRNLLIVALLIVLLTTRCRPAVPEHGAIRSGRELHPEPAAGR